MANTIKEIGLTGYRWATAGTRSRFARLYAAQRTYPAALLFYHRVASHTMNPWSIHQLNFQKQIDWIAEIGSPASIAEIRETQLLGSRAEPMIGVTFDDGYAENCEFAIPYLIQLRIPCTYFVTTHYIATGECFPHDVARGKPLKPNTIAQVQWMADQGIEIGAHTHTHFDFGQPASPSTLRREIADVRKTLQDWTGQPIKYFAFPYGGKHNISQEAIDMVFESGFECFVSAAGGFNWPGQDANHLQRIHGDPGMAAFKNWLTYDPRKIRLKSPIVYDMPSMAARTDLVATQV